MKPAKAKSATTVQRALRELRRLIDSSPDVVECKIAYEIECALRWATEPGIRGWPTPVAMVREGARLLRLALDKERSRAAAPEAK